jgi:hypothetical protein
MIASSGYHRRINRVEITIVRQKEVKGYYRVDRHRDVQLGTGVLYYCMGS